MFPKTVLLAALMMGAILVFVYVLTAHLSPDPYTFRSYDSSDDESSFPSKNIVADNKVFHTYVPDLLSYNSRCAICGQEELSACHRHIFAPDYSLQCRICGKSKESPAHFNLKPGKDSLTTRSASQQRIDLTRDPYETSNWFGPAR